MRVYYILLFFILTSLLNIGRIVKLQKERLTFNSVVFLNVNVIPMSTDTVIRNQTVLIKNGLIEKIGKSENIDITPKTTVVYGQGKYLLPGLADMHVHIVHENDLRLFLANGVTTVQNMHGNESWIINQLWGIPIHIDLRSKIASGKILGPHMYTAGPILEGEPMAQKFMRKVKTAKKGEKEVISQKKKGYDFIKVNENLSKKVYFSIIEAARNNDIVVKGHVPLSVGVDGVLKSGQVSIEHLNGIIDPVKANFRIDEDNIDNFSKNTKIAGIWNCPTMVVQTRKGLSDERIGELSNHPVKQYLTEKQQDSLDELIKEMRKSKSFRRNNQDQILNSMYKAVNSLNNEGANLLLGTDCGSPLIYPGWSCHEELLHFVNAGLSPYDALKTCTINPAKHLGLEKVTGTLDVGKHADIILIKQNPLDDIANISTIEGVMINGAWYTRNELLEN